MSATKLQTKWVRLTKEQRLYHLPFPIIGLTGGIATGKSTVAEFFKQKKIPLLSADELVKKIYAGPETIQWVQENFPFAIRDNVVNFSILREKVFSDHASKEKIESFIYSKLPLMFSRELTKLKNPNVLIYDVPLLFERRLEHLVDVVIVVYASEAQQKSRLALRDNSTPELIEAILQAQLPILQKKQKADLIIDNTKMTEDLEKEFKVCYSELFQSE